jgi:hypothetical protein
MSGHYHEGQKRLKAARRQIICRGLTSRSATECTWDKSLKNRAPIDRVMMIEILGSRR